jgi:uncharacterized protein (DUF952 family)
MAMAKSMSGTMTMIFKIVSKAMWDDAIASGVFNGAAIDRADGYIHFSDQTQVVETAQKHFAGQDDLLLVAFDAALFGDALKWEASRGGALFPHLYGKLDPNLALWAKPLPWSGSEHEFPADWTI